MAFVLNFSEEDAVPTIQEKRTDIFYKAQIMDIFPVTPQGYTDDGSGAPVIAVSFLCADDTRGGGNIQYVSHTITFKMTKSDKCAIVKILRALTKKNIVASKLPTGIDLDLLLNRQLSIKFTRTPKGGTAILLYEHLSKDKQIIMDRTKHETALWAERIRIVEDSNYEDLEDGESVIDLLAEFNSETLDVPTPKSPPTSKKNTKRVTAAPDTKSVPEECSIPEEMSEELSIELSDEDLSGPEDIPEVAPQTATEEATEARETAQEESNDDEEFDADLYDLL